MLQLPILHNSIPLHLQPQSSRKRCAQLAQAVYDAGLVRSAHIPRRFTGDYLQVSQRALQSWLDEQIADLRCLQPTFTLVVGNIDLDDGFGRLAGPQEGALIEWYGLGGTYAVGAELERLEALRPRLGMSVLSALEEAAWRTLPIYTPRMILEAASDNYWYGEEDEESAVEMCCESEEDARDMRENMVTRRMINATFPAWALSWRRRRPNLAMRTLKALYSTIRDRRARAVIEDVLALSELKLPERDWTEREGRFIGFAGLLTWGDRDQLSMRVVDDYQQMVGESGDYFEDSGRQFLRLDDSRALSSWIESMTPWFAAVKLIDGLLHKLSLGS